MDWLRNAIAAVTIVVVLGGCETNVKSTIYVRDVTDLPDVDDAIGAPGVLQVEMLTKKSCMEKREDIASLLSSFFMEIDKLQCVSRGSDDFFQANFSIPMVMLKENGNLNLEYEGGISAQVRREKAGYSLFVSVKRDKLARLDQLLQDEFMASGGIKPEATSVNITVSNDSRDKFTLSTDGVYLDGKAVIAHSTETVELGSRESSTIGLSDVSISSLAGNGKYAFAYIASIAPADDSEVKDQQEG